MPEDAAVHLESWETRPPPKREIALGFTALSVWSLFFAAGVLIPTNRMRGAIVASIEKMASCSSPTAMPYTGKEPRDDLSTWEIVGYFAVTLPAFTVTNLLFIAIMASFLGCMSRRWSTPFEYQDSSAAASTAVDTGLREMRRAYMTAVLRGFLAYALIVGGYLVVIPEDSLGDITPGQYIRLAGLVTAISFLVGFEPNSIGRLLKLVFSPDEGNRLRAQAAAYQGALRDAKARGAHELPSPATRQPNRDVFGTNFPPPME